MLIKDPSEPKIDTNYDNFVVVTGTPVINTGKPGWEDKVAKLRSRLSNILNKHNIDFPEEGALKNITIPFSKDGTRTESLAFLNLGNEKRAGKALQVLDNYAMSDKFVFSAIPFSKFEDTVNVPSVYKPPSIMPEA